MKKQLCIAPRNFIIEKAKIIPGFCISIQDIPRPPLAASAAPPPVKVHFELTCVYLNTSPIRPFISPSAAAGSSSSSTSSMLFSAPVQTKEFVFYFKGDPSLLDFFRTALQKAQQLLFGMDTDLTSPVEPELKDQLGITHDNCFLLNLTHQDLLAVLEQTFKLFRLDAKKERKSFIWHGTFTVTLAQEVIRISPGHRTFPSCQPNALPPEKIREYSDCLMDHVISSLGQIRLREEDPESQQSTPMDTDDAPDEEMVVSQENKRRKTETTLRSYLGFR